MAQIRKKTGEQLILFCLHDLAKHWEMRGPEAFDRIGFGVIISGNYTTISTINLTMLLYTDV